VLLRAQPEAPFSTGFLHMAALLSVPAAAASDAWVELNFLLIVAALVVLNLLLRRQ
jgi:hypothetical protein